MTRLPLLAAFLLAAPAAAQDQDYSKVEIRTERVAPGVHALFGAGGNIGVSTGADGIFIIDDQFAPLTPKIVAALKAIDPKPVRFVLDTHWHFDHTGGNENIGAMGALIVAQDNVRVRMSTEQFIGAMNVRTPPSPAKALPVVTFSESTTFHINGDTIRAVHVPHAHTDGDALVHFAKANVIHMGDTYFSNGYPFIDLSSGGSVDGYIAAVETGIAMGDAATRYIPGHGPVTGRTELIAFRDMLRDVAAKVRAGVANGRTLEQVTASRPTATYDAKWGGAFMKPDQFVGIVYASLKSPAAHAHDGHTHSH